MGNVAQFTAEIKKIQGKMDEIPAKNLKEIAETAFDILISHSPVKTGSYVLSHRIGINGPSTAPPTLHGGLQLGKSAKVLAKSRKAALNRINKDTTSIIIDNSIPYAINVEFGWVFEHGTAPGYYPYTKTANEIRALYGLF